MEALDPGWAAVLGAVLGALATAIIGPILRDALARRANKVSSARETRYRLAIQILDGLDAITGLAVDERQQKVAALTKLTNEASLVDKQSDIANMVDLTSMYLARDEDLVRNLVAGYTQGVITRWGRFDSIPTIEEFIDEVGRLIEAAEHVEAHRVESEHE